MNIKEGIYIGKDDKGATVLIDVTGKEPFFKVSFWVTGLDRNVIVENANTKQIQSIDWNNVKRIEDNG